MSEHAILTGSDRDIDRLTRESLVKDGGSFSRFSHFSHLAKPDPIVSSDAKPREYPLNNLPGDVRAAVDEVTGFVQCPVVLAASSAVTALSIAGQGLASVQRAKGLVAPVSVYTLTVAESGERKSTLDSFFVRPVQLIEAESLERERLQRSTYVAKAKAWEAREDAILNAIKQKARKGEDTQAEERRLIALQSEKPEEPKAPRLIYGDATPEALGAGMRRWSMAGVVSSEAGVIFGGAGMSKDSLIRNMAFYNAAWDGFLPSVDRITRTSTSGGGECRLTMGLAVQPDVLKRFIESTNGTARGSGFLARFLVAHPQSTQGSRLYKEPPTAWPAVTRFNTRIREMIECHDSEGGVPGGVLTLTTDAKAEWRKFHDTVERELGPSGKLSESKDFASKAADNAARLAALFHLYERGVDGEIEAHHMLSAARIVSYHMFESVRFVEGANLSQETRNAIKLERFMVKRCEETGGRILDRAELLQNGPRCTRNAQTLDAALAVLVSCNRVAVCSATRSVAINPHLIGGQEND